jgi:hypothetical protein
MKEPRTVDEWKARFKNLSRRKFPIFPPEIFFSEAYLTLEPSAAKTALIFAWSQVRWEPKGRGARKKWQRMDDDIYLPTNALIALGIKSSETHTKLRKELVRRGFLDVVKTGSYLNPGVFKISERWREYPHGDYLPKDKRPAGKSMGHRIPKGGMKRTESRFDFQTESVQFSKVKPLGG